MSDGLDLATLTAWLDQARVWAGDNLLGLPALLQLLGLALIAAIALPLGRAARAPAERLLGRLGHAARLEPVIPVLVGLLPAISLLALIWLAIGLVRRLALPEASYLLALVASLLTAWVVIRLAATLIHNPALSRAFAIVAWTIAALNITGLLGPTVAALDAAAIQFGDLRISVLTVVKTVLALAVLLWVASAVSRVLETRINRIPDLTPSVQVLLGKLLKITLLTFAVVIALNSVGIDLTALAVFSGAVGLGLGFGLQKVVSNLLSGVILLLDKSVKPGDVIELGETFGWISSMGARYISVVTRDGKEFLIPNEDLITHRVVNWSYTDQLVRLEIPFGVSYGSDPHEVRRIAREAAAGAARVVTDTAPVCHLVGFGDSSIDFLLRFWIRDPQNGVVNIKSEVLLAVWDAFKAHGIQIPFPHRHLVVPEAIPVELRSRTED